MRRIRKFAALILIAALTFTFLTACGKTPGKPVDPSEALPGTGDDVGDHVTEPGDGKSPAETVGPVTHVPESTADIEIVESYDRAAAEKGFAAFATELLRRNMKDGENTLVSPLSAALALGMTANGAAGGTMDAFRDLFGMNIDALNAWASDALKVYSNLGGSTKSTLVNSLWCDPSLRLQEVFTARCQNNYEAELFMADLQDKATVDALNKWVRDATEGLIPKTVDEFSRDAVLALVNAVYLLNKFENPLMVPHENWKMDFTAANGRTSRPEGMLNGTRKELYLKHEGGSGVVLPYDDGRLGFMLMLPDKEKVSLSDYLSTWDGETVKNLLDNKKPRKVDLRMPKYEIEWSGSLKEALSDMGLKNAFSSAADFTAMAEDDSLCIGDVIHKTVLKVTEEGTEAAAVTVVEMTKTSAYPHETVIQLIFNRPFVCGIVDMDTGTPLFLGTVENLG